MKIKPKTKIFFFFFLLFFVGRGYERRNFQMDHFMPYLGKGENNYKKKKNIN